VPDHTGAVSKVDAQQQILDATIACIVRDGIEGASMRSVAREADVSLGLITYHFDDKRTLIETAFRQATDRLLEASLDCLDDLDEPDDQVRAFVRGAFQGQFLEADYLALRIALWALSRTDDDIAAAERDLYERYASRLASLIRQARPKLSAAQAKDRATDVIVTQNGLWLNWARHLDRADLDRGLQRCEQLALG